MPKRSEQVVVEDLENCLGVCTISTFMEMIASLVVVTTCSKWSEQWILRSWRGFGGVNGKRWWVKKVCHPSLM